MYLCEQEEGPDQAASFGYHRNVKLEEEWISLFKRKKCYF